MKPSPYVTALHGAKLFPIPKNMFTSLQIYITEDEHLARMEKLYNRSSIKYDDIVDMINKQRDTVRKDWLPKN